MGKQKIEYVCRECGAKFPKWTGRCNHCGEWDCLEEVGPVDSKAWVESSTKPTSLDAITTTEAAERWRTDVREFDRVVGDGIVRGSVGLLGGTPGVGKSTLILQLLARLVKIELKVLYVSGEESANQIKHRADRLLIDQTGVLVLIESNLENIMANVLEHQPDFIVVDSIQTLYSSQFSANAGSVTQVRETAAILMKYAKQNNVAVTLIGHVTKEGDIAGPRTLEHMVDYVLYLEGEKKEQQRLLRSVKNRFGTINEIGLFKMTARGLVEIRQANDLFVSQFISKQPGTAIFPAYEGSRTLFLEIQVLVGDTQQNYPARTTVGMDRNRLQLIVAILEKHLRIDFSKNDIFVNLAGGFRVIEPAMDLPLIAAILSSYGNRLLPASTIFIGESALTGEFRSVPSLEERLYEAERCGFKQAVVPKSAGNGVKNSKLSLDVAFIDTVSELDEFLR